MGHRNSHELELLPIEAVCTVMGYTHAVSQGCKTLSLILEDTGVCVSAGLELLGNNEPCRRSCALKGEVMAPVSAWATGERSR